MWLKTDIIRKDTRLLTSLWWTFGKHFLINIFSHRHGVALELIWSLVSCDLVNLSPIFTFWARFLSNTVWLHYAPTAFTSLSVRCLVLGKHIIIWSKNIDLCGNKINNSAPRQTAIYIAYDVFYFFHFLINRRSGGQEKKKMNLTLHQLKGSHWVIDRWYLRNTPQHKKLCN